MTRTPMMFERYHHENKEHSAQDMLWCYYKVSEHHKTKNFQLKAYCDGNTRYHEGRRQVYGSVPAYVELAFVDLPITADVRAASCAW